MCEASAGERDARSLGYVALYGSLRRHGEIEGKPDLRGCLTPAGTAVIEGTLIDLGAYPGLVAGGGNVQAELYEVVDREVLHIIDRFERYDPGDLQGSLYVRRAVRLLRPNVMAWVYVYNGPVGDAPEIAGGDWVEHAAARGTSRATGS